MLNSEALTTGGWYRNGNNNPLKKLNPDMYKIDIRGGGVNLFGTKKTGLGNIDPKYAIMSGIGISPNGNMETGKQLGLQNAVQKGFSFLS